MDIQNLKERIISDGKIRDILIKLNMHHIKETDSYFSCGMPDGDNPKSTIVYKDSLFVDAHTRNIEDSNNFTDIISLVLFVKKMYFFHGVKWISDVCGYDFYERDYKKPKLLSFLDNIFALRDGSEISEDIKVEPKDERILEAFPKFKSKLFFKDNISYKVQGIFDIRYDWIDNRIAIPIRDEHGNFIGIKGRINSDLILSFESKYNYIESCNKSHILFGLDKSYEYIKEEGIVYVAESEKAVMQGWTKGIRNVVGLGGKKMSKVQVQKLTHLGVDICLCLDDKADMEGEEVDKEFYKDISLRFLDGQKVYAILDKDNKVLGDKDSPFDHLDRWEELLGMKRLIK